jgi:hypothetical protein
VGVIDGLSAHTHYDSEEGGNSSLGNTCHQTHCHDQKKPQKYALLNLAFHSTNTSIVDSICTAIEGVILRKIFGPVNIDSLWRIRNNMETDNLIEGADIVRFIKAQRIKLLWHICRMN